MKSLSQSEYGELRGLYESVYAPKFESILDEFTDEDLDDLTDEYIEEQVTEFFQECLEEGLDIEIVEQTICESIDSSLDLLTERVDPKETQRRRTQAKDRLETSRAMRSAASKPKSSTPERDAGAEARARLTSNSSDKKANRLAQVKSAVKKAGEIAKGGVGLAARAVGTAQRAGSAVKSAAKKGYERGKQGSSGGSSTSSAGTSSAGSSTSSAGTSSAGSSTSSAGTSSAGSSGSGSSSSSPAPTKRKDGLLKRGLKKLVRGAAKAVSVGAGAVKAGADYVSDKARKESMNYKEFKTIQELYNSIYESKQIHEEEVEQIDEATAMAKRGYDEAPIRQKIAKSTGGGKSADRATALEKKPTYGDNKAAQQRSNLARKQRTDFRKTTSSSPGLHGYGHKSDDPKVKAKQAARGAQRGVLTPNEKKELNREEFQLDQMIESLIERGHTEQEAYSLVAQFTLDEAITSEKGKAKAAEMIAKRTTASGRAKPGQGANVSQIKHIRRANVDGYGGTPPNLKVAKNPVKSNFTGLNTGTGNKAARRAAALNKEEYVGEAQEARNNPEKYEREQAKKSAPVRGERTPMPPRGDKRREDFEKWYAANVR